MKNDPKTLTDIAEIRHRAEQQLKGAHKGAIPNADTARKLLHELQVHQIELEMQNQELRSAQASAEEALTRYAELYDFSLISYFTFNHNGTIREVNLTGANLLGLQRAKLLGRRFDAFISAESQAVFKAFLTKLSAGHTQEVCEVALLHADKRPLFAQIEAVTDGDDGDGDGPACRVVVTDITQRKQAVDALQQATERLSLATSAAGMGIWDWDIAKNELIWDEQMYRLYGICKEYFGGAYDAWTRCLVPEDLARSKEAVLAALRGEREFSIEFRIRWPDGSIHDIAAAAKVIRDQAGRPQRMVGTNHDITVRKQAETAARKAEQHFRIIFESAPLGIALIDSVTGKYIDVNPKYAEIAGRTVEEMKNLGRLRITHPDEEQEEQTNVTLLNAHKIPSFKMSKRIIRPDGSFVWINLSNTPVEMEDQSRPYHLCMIEDVTEKKQNEAIIWRQANFDPLTNLPNRRMFHDRLEQEMKKAYRSGLPLALLLFDLDHFKQINDTLGHAMGDILLKDAAQRLSSCVRAADTVARLGGDEFTVILGELDDPDTVGRIAQDALRKLAEPFRLGDKVAYISTSIGISMYPADTTAADALLRNADQAMYAAKTQGRNCYSYFTASMQQAAQTKMQLANDLRNALADNQLRLYYQPIVELATGSIHKAEALIRWQHPTRGLINPAEFIPIAEDTGMIVDIGDWVFREAASQAAYWRASHHAAFQISINVSPVQFHSKGCIQKAWFDHLQKSGLPGQSIAVEITEGLLLDTDDIVTSQLYAFRDAGMHVSLDDFGTGYSALAYLKKFNIDYLKIDRSFVANIAPGSNDMALCEAIIVMAHKLGLKVIGEGVETAGQRDLLVAAGCDYAQGYLYSKPVPSEQFAALLKQSPLKLKNVKLLSYPLLPRKRA